MFTCSRGRHKLEAAIYVLAVLLLVRVQPASATSATDDVDVAAAASAATELVSDDPQPYPNGRHGPTHSHERLRRLVGLNNQTYETISADQTAGQFSDVQVLIDSMKTMAHIVTVTNPLEQFAIAQPPLGCDGGDHRSTVPNTTEYHHCVLGTNAGFFNTHTGACLGNLVTDGVLVQNTGIQNANLGVLKNGTIVVGYLSQEFIDANPFQQLVAGVGWLVRKGQSFIEHSLLLEQMSTQESGGDFAYMISARVAVGHDLQGRIKIMQVEGKSRSRGVDLFAFADLLVANGFYNAINLDGGGSATLVVNGTLTNYPSDTCAGMKEVLTCPRRVSTALCVRSPNCRLSASCSQHGDCVKGLCVCHFGYTGSACETEINGCMSVNCTGSTHCVRLAPGLAACDCDVGFGIISLEREPASVILAAATHNGSLCERTNPCRVNNGGCVKEHEICSWNSPAVNGTCSCQLGYRRVGDHQCVDVNECFTGHNCGFDEGLRCVNTDGSYYCTCQANYYGIAETGSCQLIPNCKMLSLAVLLLSVVAGLLLLCLIVCCFVVRTRRRLKRYQTARNSGFEQLPVFEDEGDEDGEEELADEEEDARSVHKLLPNTSPRKLTSPTAVNADTAGESVQTIKVVLNGTH